MSALQASLQSSQYSTLLIFCITLNFCGNSLNTHPGPAASVVVVGDVVVVAVEVFEDAVEGVEETVVVVGEAVVVVGEAVVVVGDAVVVEEAEVVDPSVLFQPAVKTGQVLRSGICWSSQAVKCETSE